MISPVVKLSFIRSIDEENKAIEAVEDAKCGKLYDQSAFDAGTESAYESGNKFGYKNGYEKGNFDGRRDGKIDYHNEMATLQKIADASFQNGYDQGVKEYTAAREQAVHDAYHNGHKDGSLEYDASRAEYMSESYRTGYYDGKNKLPSKY